MKIFPALATRSQFPSPNPRSWLLWGVLILQVLLAEDLRANVYATNLRFNGGTTNVTVPVITNIHISYILNEPATAGVVINIKSGATTLRNITLTNPSPGTLRGTNLVAWDGKDTNGVSIGAGTYTFSITASTTGYEDWTQITDDGNPGNFVWEARGIAVNKNANSPYYGRVFVSNAHVGAAPGVKPGDTVGILTLNADGSPADETVESGFWNSTGGWDWAGDYYSPWKLEV
ncbi:MAG TPA: FlgD immunoglobulin-like domain containing protein, partial [Candidatus Eisenbacteria bacterium]|nr:FlgD immunoglobulin-like domain containing protein [Candidatus Eisenbacteria bacterium]